MKLELALCVFLVAGCDETSSPSDGPVDSAPPADLTALPALPARLSCYLDALPTTAADPIPFTAKTEDSQLVVVPGVLARLTKDSNGAILGSATSDAAGMVALSLATGGTQPAAYDWTATFTATGFVPTIRYFPAPLGATLAAFARMFRPADLDYLYTLGSATRDPSLGTLTIAIFDCRAQLVANAVVTLDPPAGLLLYPDYANNVYDPAATMTTPSGAVLAYNVPPGLVNVSIALASGVQITRFSIPVVAGAVVSVNTR